MKKTCSSSEDESMTEALKEATDYSFLKETFFTEKSCKDKFKGKSVDSYKQKSLRPNLERKSEFTLFGVSDAFQNYVAKNLSKILDKNIKFVDDFNNPPTVAEESNLECGIRLLSTLDIIVSNEKEDVPSTESSDKRKRRRREIIKEDKSIPFEVKVKEAAVDPEWILSKSDTKIWVNRRKEADFKYKTLQDGRLVEQ